MTRRDRIDWATHEAIKKDVDAAFETISAKYGIKLVASSHKNANSTSFTFFANGNCVAEATASGRELPLALITQMKRYSMSEGWANSGRDDFRLVDFNPRAKSAPWIGENRSGTRFKFNHTLAVSMWGSKAAPIAVAKTSPGGGIGAILGSTVVEKMLADAKRRAEATADEAEASVTKPADTLTPAPRVIHEYDGDF